MKKIFQPAAIVFLVVAIGTVAFESAAGVGFDCTVFADSWSSEVASYDDGCGTPGTTHRQVTEGGVTFDALFGFMILLPPDTAESWDKFADTDQSTSFGVSLGTTGVDAYGMLREFETMPLGHHAVRGRQIAISYDTAGGEYQEVYAAYRVRYNTCITDILIRGTGPANDNSYGGKVFAATYEKIRQNTERMKTFGVCNPSGQAPSAPPLVKPPAQVVPPKSDLLPDVSVPPKTPPQVTTPATRVPPDTDKGGIPPSAPLGGDTSDGSGSVEGVPRKCTPEQVKIMGEAAKAAEDALAKANRKLDEATEKAGRLDSVIRAISNEISILRGQIGKDTDNASAAKLQNDISSFSVRLANKQAERAAQETELAVAKDVLSKATEAYRRALSEALACTRSAERGAAEEASAARKAAAERAHEAHIEETNNRVKKLEKALADEEFREKVRGYYEKLRSGSMPPSVTPPWRADDDAYTKICKRGEVRNEESYECSYYDLNENRAPIFQTSHGEYQLTPSELKSFRAIFRGMNTLFSNSTTALDLGGPLPTGGRVGWELNGPGILTTPDITLPGARVFIEPIFEGLGYISQRLDYILSMTVPIRISTYRFTDSYTCNEDGKCWQASWTKRTRMELLDSQSFDIEFTCNNYGANTTDRTVFHFGEPDRNRCKAQDNQDLILTYGKLVPDAMQEAWGEANLPPNDRRCPLASSQ